MAEQSENKSTSSRRVSGLVVSARADKTITVLIERKVLHPLYRKYVRRMTKLYAHDEHNSCKENDRVVIQQCRPLSKTKCWQLVSIQNKSNSVSSGDRA